MIYTHIVVLESSMLHAKFRCNQSTGSRRRFLKGFLSKTSQIIFYLHPGFFHMEDEKGNKLHLFKKYFKMMFFLLYKSSLILIVIHFNRVLCDESFCKEKLK